MISRKGFHDIRILALRSFTHVSVSWLPEGLAECLSPYFVTTNSFIREKLCFRSFALTGENAIKRDVALPLRGALLWNRWKSLSCSHQPRVGYCRPRHTSRGRS